MRRLKCVCQRITNFSSKERIICDREYLLSHCYLSSFTLHCFCA